MTRIGHYLIDTCKWSNWPLATSTANINGRHQWRHICKLTAMRQLWQFIFKQNFTSLFCKRRHWNSFSWNFGRENLNFSGSFAYELIFNWFKGNFGSFCSEFHSFLMLSNWKWLLRRRSLVTCDNLHQHSIWNKNDWIFIMLTRSTNLQLRDVDRVTRAFSELIERLTRAGPPLLVLCT